MAHPRYVGLRLSTTAGAVPTAADMAEGELAINVADGRVYALAGSTVIDLTDRYSVAEIDSLLDGKAAASHTHPWGEVTSKPDTATRWPAVIEVEGLSAALDAKLDAASRYADAEAVAAMQAAPEWHASDWDAAHNWGDHSTEGYLKSGGAKKDVLSNKPVYYSGSGDREINLDDVSWGDCVLASASKVLSAEPLPFNSSFYYIETQRQYSSSAIIQSVWEYQGNRFAWRSIRSGHTPPPWAMEYTNQNTSTDPSGFIRANGSSVALTTDDSGDFATASQGGNADTAYSWGDHALAGYLKSVTWGDVGGKPAFATVATSGAYGDLSGKPSFGTAASLDVPASGDAAAGEVVKGSDSRLSDNRAPTAHTHKLADISDTGTAAGKDATEFDPAGSAAAAEQRIRETLRQTPDPLLMHFL